MSASKFVPASYSPAVIVIIAIIVLSTSTSEACFIRNCPKGGKRSLESAMVPKRECMKCGPGNIGQCVGPNTCCSAHFGCHFGTKEAEICQQENQSLTPCYVIGDVCGARDSGNCVADGICCDSESCAFNDRCRQKNQPKEVEGTANKSDILHLIQKLLRVRDYD